jgi:hypothetical protein
MTSKGKRPKPLDSGDVRAVVLAAITNGAYVESFSFHARFDNADRHLSVDDVIHGLKKKWESCKVQEFNDDEWQWKYLIATTDIEGLPLLIPIALDPRNTRFTVLSRFHDE